YFGRGSGSAANATAEPDECGGSHHAPDGKRGRLGNLLQGGAALCVENKLRSGRLLRSAGRSEGKADAGDIGRIKAANRAGSWEEQLEIHRARTEVLGDERAGEDACGKVGLHVHPRVADSIVEVGEAQPGATAGQVLAREVVIGDRGRHGPVTG